MTWTCTQSISTERSRMPIWSVASSRKTKFGPANELLQSWERCVLCSETRSWRSRAKLRRYAPLRWARLNQVWRMDDGHNSRARHGSDSGGRIRSLNREIGSEARGTGESTTESRPRASRMEDAAEGGRPSNVCRRDFGGIGRGGASARGNRPTYASGAH